MPLATGNENHNIIESKAALLTKNYRVLHRIEESKGFYFGRAKIEAMLAERGCKGIRIYRGLNSIGEDNSVLVAVDENWNDIAMKNIAEYGISTALQPDNLASSLARD